MSEYGSCKDIPDARCCNSCHDDEEDGYGSSLDYGQEGLDGKIYYLCCTVVDSAKKQGIIK